MYTSDSHSRLFIIINALHVSLHAGSCDGYMNRTEPWRNYLFRSSSFPDYPKDDAHLTNKWWRFTGIGGDRITKPCFGGPIGGFKHSIRVPFPEPDTESSDPTTGIASADVSVCGAYVFEMAVTLCPGGFYIYKPSSHPYSGSGYTTCKE